MRKTILPIIQPTASKPASLTDIAKNIRPSNIEGLKMVFVNMPLRETAVPNTTPEGPLLMATNLRQNYGVDARIIDLNAYRIKDELAKQRNLPNGRHLTDAEVFNLISADFRIHGEPDLIGFSGKITTLRWQEKIARMIRNLLPDVFLVSGGGLATELKTGLFNYIPELDAAAHSEGDKVILKICYDAMAIKKYGFASVLNSGKLAPYHMGYVSGRHRFLYAGDRPTDLDSLPFADLGLLAKDVFGFEILKYYLGNAIFGVSAGNSSAIPFTMNISTTSVSSRGCPYSCKYCYRGTQGERRWVVRSAEHIFRQLVDYKEKYGIDFHCFVDDNFAVSYGRIQDLVPRLGPLGIRWGTLTRLDEAAGLKPKPNRPGECVFENPLRIKLMAQAGCIYIGFGPESANVKVLEVLGKGGFTLSSGFIPTKVNGKTYNFPRPMIEGIKNCREVGIHANCTWIKGNPTETLEDLKETVAFMAWQEEYYSKFGIPPEAVNKRMFTLTWYPGTELIHNPRVRQELTRLFDLKFDPVTHAPVCDESFHNYCLALDDATKVLEGPDGKPLNFSDIPNDTFLKIRELVDSGRTLEILNL